MCRDMAQVSTLVKQMDKDVYRLLNRNIPGTTTFLFPPSKGLPHFLKKNRRGIGICIPSHYFAQALLAHVAEPLLFAYLPRNADEELLFPEELVSNYQHDIDSWIDDEMGQGFASTVIDCTIWPVEILQTGQQNVVL